MGFQRYTHDRYTPQRHLLLARIGQQPRNYRGKGRTGSDCMRLGWTRWVHQGIGRGPDSHEELTDLGRARLAEWNAERGDPLKPRAASSPRGGDE